MFEQLASDDLIWLAGLLEGEGSFIVKPSIGIQMTDEDIIERVASLFGTNVYFCSKQKAHHKDSYKTSLFGWKAIELMELLHPLMGKRRQSQIETSVLAFRNRLVRRTIDVNDVLARLESGESVTTIADAIGFNRCSVYRILREAGTHLGKPHRRTSL